MSGDPDLEQLAAEWLSLPDLAEAIGESFSTVRLWVRERKLVTVDIGTPSVRRVPAEFVSEGQLIKGLPGALTVLSDAGFDAEQAVRWLLTTDDTLGSRPVDLMAAGRHTAVKRRAMALAF